jgi:uncharacterized integral membrane protein (TIGR00698 family)
LEYKVMTKARLLPGLLILGTIAIAASGLADALPYVNELVLAIATGAVVANTIGVPDWAIAGIKLHKLLLETGIVLLGAQLTLEKVAAAGPIIILLSTVAVLFGLITVELLSRQLFDLPSRTSSLLAAGSSVCGVSAVVAVAGSIEAKEEEIAYAAATILIFDAITLVAFPAVGEVLGLSGKVFGIWAGLSMFSTGPVAAAGFAHSEVAGQWATITKLVRNSFIGLVAVAYSLNYAAKHTQSDYETNIREIWSEFPKFLVGFLLIMLISNLGVVPSEQLATFDSVSDWLFLLAFAGLGFDIRVSEMRSSGTRPLLVVLLHLLLISTVMLTVLSLIL